MTQPVDGVGAAEPQHTIARICRLLEEAPEVPPVPELARAAAMSTSHFRRTFRSVVGMAPGEYARSVRAGRLRAGLAEAESVTGAIYDAGYPSAGRFYEEADRSLGMTPTQYRAGGSGTTIRFGVGECSLGAILVGATERGVCAVVLGDDPQELVAELHRRFPAAELVGGDGEFERWMAGVVGLVEAPGTDHDLPMDIRGTAFQRLVWAALRRIPPGSTVSYAEVARQVGRPAASRAVAAACAANHLAVLIPCHRVVRTDGSLSGYRWGVERKAELLRREGVRAAR